MTIRLHPDLETMRRVAAVARAEEPATLVVTGGVLLNVFTEELLAGWGVAVAGDRVAYVGPDAEERAGPATEVVQLDGQIVAPGLVESHTHVTRATLREMLRHQVGAGVTTTVIESMEIAYVAGPEGVRELLADAARSAGRSFFTVSGLIGTDTAHDRRLAPADDWAALLDDPQVLGLGELYWADVLRGHDRTERLIQAALDRGLTVEGHGAGARPPALAALAAFGVEADHEGLDAEDLRLRLRLGLWGEARDGATRQDLERIAPLWQQDAPDLGRLLLVTDGVEPDVLLRGDTLNRVVERAAASGLPFVRAVRLASRNAAERLGLQRWLGGLTPGSLADLVVLPGPERFRPELVLVGGARPAEPEPYRWSDRITDAVHPCAVPDALLELPPPGRWRAMELVAPTLTRELETDGRGTLPVVATDRYGEARAFRGLLAGLGLAGGAVAWSSAWESAAVLATGDRPEDVRAALHRLAELRGGVVVVAGGGVQAEGRAEVAGLYTTAPLAEVVAQVDSVHGALRDLGCQTPNPILTLETLTTAAIPFLRISPEGYFRARDGSRPGLAW